MKLLHVAVEGCGRFGTPARIEGFGPGVNILAARNEAGKSTLFRAIRTCLFERHNTTKEDVEALATAGKSLPVLIRVGFEHEGRTYEISKSFVRSKSASLTCDGAEIARGAAADEKVWELLGVSQKSAKALDDGSYGLLWIQQGRSFDAPSLSEAAKTQLNAVIEQEVGTLVGGERARLLRNTLSAEIGRYETDQGRARAGGPLHAARELIAQVRAEREDVETRLAALDAKLDELSRLRSELRSASDPVALQAMRSDHEETIAKLAEARKAGDELKRLAVEEKQSHALAEAQAEKLKDLQRRAAAIDAQRQRLTELVSGLDPIDAELAAATAALHEVTARKAALDAEADALETEERELTLLSGLAVKLAQRGLMAERLALLEGLKARAAANDAALKAAPVDDAAIRALEALEAEEATQRATLEAGAPRVAITAKAGADVRLDGAAVTGNAARAVTAPLVITVGEDVAITVSPPQATRDAAEQALARHRERLKALLARCGAADAADLRRLRGERAALEELARDLLAERKALSVKDSVSTEIETLQAAIGVIDAEARRALPEGAALPATAGIEQRKAATAERRAALRAGRSGAEAQIAAQKDAVARLLQSRAALQGEAQAVHAQLNSEVALLPDESRAALLSEAEAELAARRDAHRIRAALLAERRTHAPEDGEIERLAARADRLATALKGQQEKAGRLKEDIAKLEGALQVAGGEGLGERAGDLKEQQEMAEADEARIAERVEVLKLLRSTVDGCYAERREQLNAPLRRHLKPFLQDVFPKAEIELGENFGIAGLSRSGPGAELFGRLSLGTQEQVAVLVRLAMGAMLCERGTGVPVILDDALVFSDDERIEQMFDALNRAGRNQQVIVLTCRSRSFASLGGNELQITS